MNILSSQCDELRMQADELRGYALSVRNIALRTTSFCHEARKDLFDSAARMEQAADTITALSDKLQGVMGTRYCELFGTPERAARTLERSCHLLYGLKVDGFVACIGCPVYDEGADVDDCCYDALLGWLREEEDE